MRNTRPLKGFTLVEMMVSVALFSIVMVVALGALIAMSSAVRRAEAINSAVNNVSAAVDSISRSVRTGVNYHCGPSGTITSPQNCANLGTADSYFSYKDFNGRQISYCLSDGSAATPPVCNTTTSCTTGSCKVLRNINSTGWTTMTAPEVSIKYLAFVVEGALPAPPYPSGDYVQPKVVLLMAGTVSITATQSTSFNIQTALTQRIYDQ